MGNLAMHSQSYIRLTILINDYSLIYTLLTRGETDVSIS